MADAPAAEPRLTGSVPLYKNAEPLNRQKHKTYGVKTVSDPFSFLKGWHFVPAISRNSPMPAAAIRSSSSATRKCRFW